MKRILSLLTLLFLLQAISFAQTATEAYLFSQSNPIGTARNLGTGNSMFAIGPDFSAIGLNPSGLGGYQKSEFLLSVGIAVNSNTSAFTSDNLDISRSGHSQLSLPNLGFVLYNKPVGGLWNSSNWAIGLNRVADYNNEIQYEGRTLGSITDAWRENATGIDPDDLNGFEEGLAYNTGAIYDFEDDNVYESDYSFNDQYALFKQESSTIEGGKTELFIAYGADLNRKILVGFSLGLPIVNYTKNRSYSEVDDTADGVPFFNELEYNSSLNTSGYGWNAKFGVTVKPTDFINIALAFHSPTRLSLTDNFNTTLSYDFTDENNNGAINDESPFGSFNYALRTPWSASGGIGVIAGRSGFISAHAKFTDYGSMKYKYDVQGNGSQYEQIEREVNDDINDNFGPALQINLGGELALTNYRLRGGISLTQSAYINDHSFDNAYHLGAGYRDDAFYIDLGYKLGMIDEGYLPYETIQAPQPLVVSETNMHQITTTIGFKF